MVLVGMGMMGGRLVLVKGLFDSTVLLKNRGGMRLQLPTKVPSWFPNLGPSPTTRRKRFCSSRNDHYGGAIVLLFSRVRSSLVLERVSIYCLLHFSTQRLVKESFTFTELAIPCPSFMEHLISFVDEQQD